MLTAEQKANVRAEEEFRLEVRRELEAARLAPPRNRLWSLLNSSFVLWLLSSVVVAGITAAYTRYQNSYSKERERTERVRKLDSEIENRIAQAMARMWVDLQGAKHGARYTSVAIYTNAARYLNNDFARDATSTADFSIYPEFRTRTLRSLVTELRTLVGEAERSALDRVLVNYEQLADWADVEDAVTDRRPNSSRRPNTAAGEAATKAFRHLRDTMLNSRWKHVEWIKDRSREIP
jgi:replicative superfamily II helicase